MQGNVWRRSLHQRRILAYAMVMIIALIDVGLIGFKPVFAALKPQPSSPQPSNPRPSRSLMVLTPGQDALVARLLGEQPIATIAGCKIVGASIVGGRIENGRVVARYSCPAATQEIIVELRHPGAAPEGALPAGSVAVWAPPPAPTALAEAVAKRIANDAAKLRWKVAKVSSGQRDDGARVAHGTHIAAPATPEDHDPKAVELGMAPTTEVAYNASMRHVNDGNFSALLRDMMTLARQDPHGLIIGRLVVACAGLADGPGAFERVKALMADADTHPDDALRQLVAGVAVHYRGHHTGKTITAKMADYRRGLRYLRRTGHRFDHSARYWLYTAVSLFRLGDQAGSESAIKRAIAADVGTDADVFYCRAEIYHRKNARQAVEDIKRYRTMMVQNRRNGGFSAPEKDQRVGEMQRRLEQVLAGDPLPIDERLFDPLHEGGNRPQKALIGGVLALLIFGMSCLVYWRRRRHSGST